MTIYGMLCGSVFFRSTAWRGLRAPQARMLVSIARFLGSDEGGMGRRSSSGTRDVRVSVPCPGKRIPRLQRPGGCGVRVVANVVPGARPCDRVRAIEYCGSVHVSHGLGADGAARATRFCCGNYPAVDWTIRHGAQSGSCDRSIPDHSLRTRNRRRLRAYVSVRGVASHHGSRRIRGDRHRDPV